MDFLLTAWLIVFVLMGGAIALVADNLGRKWGKKRYTFHKRIRPKYAAMIMAAGAGMLITFLTIVFIGIVSSDMRTVLLQGRKALAENEGLIRNNNALRSEGSTLRQQNKDLSTSNKELESSNSELQKKLAAANRLLNQTEGKLSLANTDLVEARKQIAPLRTILESTKSELASKKTALDAEKAALSTAKASLAKQLAEYNKLNGNYTKLNTDTNELKSYNLELSFQIDEKRKQIDDLQNQISKQTALISKLETTRQALEKTVGDLETEVRQKEQERDAAINAANLIRNGAAGMIQSSRYQPLILSNGQEIFRIDIPARSSKQDVLTSIDRALATANVQAKDLGAGEDDQMRYAKLFEYIGPNGMPVSEQSQRDTMASSMAGAANVQVLIIYSRFISFL